MNLFSLRGRASRAPGAARRRSGRFAISSIESLESRQLLAAGPLGINVEIDPLSSFVNLLQTPGRWLTAPGQSNTISLNASNDPQSDAALLFDQRVNQPYNGPDPNASGINLSGTYHLSFNGQATITPEYPGYSTPFSVQNPVYNASTNTTTVDLVIPAGNTNEFFAIWFQNTRATPTSAVNTGFSNASLIRPGYAAGSTQFYSSEFLSALAPYSVLRYLDPENTNGQPFVTNNNLVTVDAPQVDQTGMPWEYLIALANQSHTDMWVNVPEGATDAYVSAMAGIFKNGGTVGGVAYPGLDAGRKIYLEYSNEVWGGIAANNYYQQRAVQNVDNNRPLSTFPSNQHVYDNADGTKTTDVNTAVGRRYVERTADISRIFQSVLGADPNHQTIRPVLGWQENNLYFYPGVLDWYQHYFAPASTTFYGLGNANYWDPTDYSSVDAIINSLGAQETSYAIPNAISLTTQATYYGLKNVSYEGGPSISGDGTTAAGQNALAASRDPRMEQLVAKHYQNYYAAGGDTANFYSGPFVTWSPVNEWGAAETSQYGNPTASAKYRGTLDVANAQPAVVTAGVHVAPAGPTTFSAVSDTYGHSFDTPSTGYQNYWLVNVATAGTYDLGLSTGSLGGTAPGQVAVFVNDHQVGGLMSVAANSTNDLGNLVLGSGLSVISIKVVHGANDPSQYDNVYYRFQPTTFTLTAPGGNGTVFDPGFESVNVGTGYQYAPDGSPWAFSGSAGSGSGVTANGSGFTAGNPAAPQGTQVAFLQKTGTITQSVAGLSAGSYAISFQAAQRDTYQSSAEDFEVRVDGKVVGTFKPSGSSYQTYTTSNFTVSAGTHAIEFRGLDSAGGDNTAFLDAVAVVPATTPPPPPPAPPAALSAGDAGFESVGVGNGYRYNPSGSAWGFSGNAGVTGNGSGFTAGNPAAPQGTQVAFLQITGSITQSVAGWSAGTYAISFQAAQRATYQSSAEDFAVLVDGKVVGTFKPSGTSYQAYTTSSFTVSAGTHVVEFRGLDSAGGDNTAFLDAVSVIPATTPPPAPPAALSAGDAGFEAVGVGNGYRYNPSGSAWGFSGNAGVTGNGSGFTGDNPAAPQGSQVAFLQITGSITQSVAGWSAGTYAISFQAAQRATYQSSAEDFAVLVDGKVVGTFKPSGTSYQAYTTSSFTVSAGTHVVEFRGLDSAGGDNTAFLDAVSIR